jgi:DNA polymerase I-like protein with 3'-5' exonuclease and polymerase domains
MDESSYQPPKHFPNLLLAKRIAIDCETRDPNLMTKGPGGVRKDGYIVGFSVATDDGFAEYYPVRHAAGGNLNPDNAFAWLRDMLKTDIPKVGANLPYDLEWLLTENVKVGGAKYDVQIAEPLLDEDRITYRLDALAEAYLGEHKDETALIAAAVRRGIHPSKVKENLWQFHASEVAPYGRKDADLPIRIFAQQEVLLHDEKLWEVFDIETQLVDVLVAMRQRGVPVDLDRAHKVKAQLLDEQGQLMEQLKKVAERDVDIWSGDDIQAASDALKLDYPKTEKGNASFPSEFLEASEHEFFSLISKVRKLDRAGGVFIDSKIIQMEKDGKIYPTFRQVRDDRGGTKSGRFASANPNMQQVPARDPVLAPLIRSIFVPEDGCQWGVFDYSQQEPRVTVHYSYLRNFPGAETARNRYLDDPDTDYHQLVADMAGITRKNAKTLNLGLAYGMGAAKAATQLGLPPAEAKRVYEQYHANVPFIKALGEECTRIATNRGYVKTFLGRRRRFQLFGPPKYSPGLIPLKKDLAEDKYGLPLKRYFVHKAMNAVIQGSSADMIKMAMINLFKKGEVPHLTIHDELDFSVRDLDHARMIRQEMLTCVDLVVPLKVDCELGPNWGEAVEVKL